MAEMGLGKSRWQLSWNRTDSNSRVVGGDDVGRSGIITLEVYAEHNSSSSGLAWRGAELAATIADEVLSHAEAILLGPRSMVSMH